MRKAPAREMGHKRRNRTGEILKLMNYMISSNPGLNVMTSLKRLSQRRFQRRNILLMIVIYGVLEDSGAWDVVSEDDLWDDETMAQREEDYVLVREEDIAEGIACFMATYLQSLKQTKDLTPEQLQKALSRMFSVKNRKGKLRKAWDGSKVAYNVASWSATVIGIYQNPVILRVASKAFWASCHVISKLV
ncbi:uncharacterized protein LOC9300088 isoform X3 [Arabidopsis lyrata subsp. lyrata]|uniref:uncharacterized protein LOC9300088 isoform X3 n=1 Tax=Arabidopsis lyrata subsp. lyrata TaxID=81972 RepID=UPI000A29B915|nr:uncharacterized protein LOC9300088 isoform X3 [Arabidopsis lyrata subsp. lyrata]|eukprot:XP_020879828.1 uncharacterized protein LOC9300088 isoform X3 [Arabidopsis lyrata subsp. lyrata]